jgi:hypothetical protein
VLGEPRSPHVSGVEGRAVCGGPPGCPRGDVRPRVRTQVSCRPPDDHQGPVVGMARAAEEAAAQALETRPAQAAIDEVLRANLDAPRKQRHAITRIYDRLIAEHGMTDVSYPVVRAYVAERRPQIRADAGRGPVEVFVLQSHRPGAEAEVDFGEVAVQLAGEQVSCFLFCFRLSFSGKAVPPGLAVGRAGGVLRAPRACLRGARRGCRPGRSATTTSSPRPPRCSGSPAPVGGSGCCCTPHTW